VAISLEVIYEPGVTARKREKPMNETERRKLITLDMKLRLRDSRDPILAQKDVALQHQRDAPAAREAAREVLRKHGRSSDDHDDDKM
jgi:hypothetical protein